MQNYCLQYCKYNSVCNKKDKDFLLESTTRANKLMNFEKLGNFDFNSFPAKQIDLIQLLRITIKGLENGN
jgi:hypothetical protein